MVTLRGTEELDKFKALRDKALITLDMEWARAMLPGATNDEVRLIAMHKARYDCVSIPDQYRHESGRWLRERGYGALGGIPLLPDGQLPE